MITTILAILACGGSAYVGWQARYLWSRARRRREKRQLLEINRFDNGLVLPAVDDPRWEVKPGPCAPTTQCPRNVMEIGEIRCCMNHGVLVGGMGVEQTAREDWPQLLEYAQEVRRRTLDRIVQDSIDAAEHPRLES